MNEQGDSAEAELGQEVGYGYEPEGGNEGCVEEALKVFRTTMTNHPHVGLGNKECGAVNESEQDDPLRHVCPTDLIHLEIGGNDLGRHIRQPNQEDVQAQNSPPRKKTVRVAGEEFEQVFGHVEPKFGLVLRNYAKPLVNA